MDPELIAKAHAAIAKGADPQAVAARFRDIAGQDLPSPAVAAGQIEPPGAPAAEPPPSRAYMPPFARDAIAFTPEQAKAVAPVLAATAMSAIPGGGFFGRQAVAGATGAVMGALEAEPGERMKGARTGGLLGLGAGLVGEAATPLLNAAMRRGAGRGARVARELRAATGMTEDVNTVRDRADAAVSAARATHYAPLDKMGAINDARINAWFEARGLTAKPRTLKELQNVASKTAKMDPVAADDLRGLMRQAMPGLGDADAAYATAIKPQTAMREGARLANRPAADIERAQRGLLAPELDHFRQGQLYKILASIERRDEGSVEMLRRFMDAGPETMAQIRTLFPDDASFTSFVEVLGRERSAEKVGQFIRQTAPFAIPGLIGAGVATGVNSLFK